MMRQYGAHRRRGGANPLGVGVIAAGAIYYLQDPRWFSERYPPSPICRDPWQVEAFTNGLLHAARRDPGTRQWRDSYWSGRSDMAVVRSLRDGRRRTVAVRLLVLHDELGLTKGTAAYPTLPDLQFYRCQPRTGRPAPAPDHAADRAELARLVAKYGRGPAPADPGLLRAVLVPMNRPAPPRPLHQRDDSGQLAIG